MSVPFMDLAAMVTERVLNAVPGGLLIAALAWFSLGVGGRQNSRVRFAVWFCTLMSIAALPFLPSLAKPAFMQAERSQIVLPAFWAVAVFCVWLLIAGLATLRIAAGLWKLRQLRRNSLPLSASSLPSGISTPAIRALIAQFQSARGIVVCTSSSVSVPTAIGFFRPAILIPDWVLRELSAEEFHVVLLHEFAHLRRFDDWTNLLQKLVRTIFFFHPAVWWIERKLSLEREMACDEAVLAETENPQAYAECLVSLAEKSFVRRGLALAQALIGRARDTSLRLARILDGRRGGSRRRFTPALAIASVIAVAWLTALPAAPRLIAFQNALPAAAGPAVIAAHVPSATPHVDVIPASLRTPASPSHRAAPPKSVVTVAHYNPPKFRGTETRVEIEKEKSIGAIPLMVRSEEQSVAPPQFVLVMQTTQIGEDGPAMVRFSVWRVTFDNENRQTVRQEMIVRLL